MKRPADPNKIKVKLAALCARSEQCRYDIAEKLKKTDLPAADKINILKELIEGKFVDDKRFAKSYVNDKIRFGGWGKRKIALHLRLKRISNEYIAEALEGFDEEEYQEYALKSARRKAASLDLRDYNQRAKAFKGLQSRGFESNIIANAFRVITSERDVEESD